jgi:outer membrane protein insertion porin family
MITIQATAQRKNVFGERGFPLFLFAFFMVFFSLCDVSGISASVVGNIEIEGLDLIGKDELLYLLDIVPGKTIDEDHVREGIKRAFLKGIFNDISIETFDGEKTTVVIRVTEKSYIKKIYVEGDYALSKKIIASLFPLQEDQYLSCDMLENAVRKLKPEIDRRGFPNAQIDATVEELAGPLRIAIHLKINTGKPERLEKIVVSGMTDEARAVMKLSEGDVFDQIVLQRDIERIKKYYKDQKYFRPVVKPYTYKDGVLNLSVDPGNRLFIAFDGNDAVSAKVLLKEMPFFEAEEFNDDIVEEAIQRMLALYHVRGFPFAEIAPVVTQKDDLINLTFLTVQGKEVRTGRISFAGARLDEAKLKNILSLKEGNVYNPDFVDSDREALKDFYYSLGHLSVIVDEFQTTYDENSQTMNIVIPVQEGPKTEIGNIDVVGANIVAEEELRRVIQLKPGDPYNEVDISNARYRLIEFYSTKGFPAADVSVRRSLAGLKANIIFTIDEGPFSVFGKTVVTGNNRTKYAVINRELLTKEHAPFDYSILRKEKQKLYKLGLFNDVNVEMLEGYDQAKDVLMSLHEANAGAVEFGLGYSDYEQYRGFLDVSYRNLWGMHRQASVRTELSSIERRLILQYYEPWFLDSATALRTYFLTEYRKELNVDNRETRYKLTRNAVNAGLERKFSNTVKAELYYEFSVVNTYDVKPDVVLSKEDTGTLVISGLRLGIIYDTRNDPFYPTKGVLSGISTKLTSPLFLSESDFIKLSFFGNMYHELITGLVMAASLRGGFARGYGATTAELPIIERFFLGGRTTVRGYEQDTLGPKGSDGNPTGGNAFLMENLEMRISLGKGIGLVTFLDGGNVWVKVKDMDPTDIKFTVGLGLRYDTPVGPLRVDYGHKLQREKDESSGELHFSIGHAF